HGCHNPLPIVGTDRDRVGIKPGYPSGRGRDTPGTTGDDRGRTGGWQGPSPESPRMNADRR
ncbi:MAG TPA: hypothetical protein VHN74_18950, partial [Candidatus Angelobacter sp.]|nr:hypothetical protein [Candidatus Angelobacter sp.]